MFDQLSVYISADWTAVHVSGWVLFPCDFRDFQSFNSSKKKKKIIKSLLFIWCKEI